MKIQCFRGSSCNVVCFLMGKKKIFSVKDEFGVITFCDTKNKLFVEQLPEVIRRKAIQGKLSEIL